MRKLLFYCFCVLIVFCACNSEKPNRKSIENTTYSNKFQINGIIDGYLANTVYLNKIFDDSLIVLDSCAIVDNQFTFQGMVEYPERYAFTFENYSAMVVFVLENTNFKIQINPIDIQNPTILNSSQNKTLSLYKKEAKNIFQKIDNLFPQFQKARLENDVEKLEEIKTKMDGIEQEFTNFSYEFIQKNNKSFVAAMILRDLLKSSTADTLRIKEMYQLLPENVKKGSDAMIIATNLELH